MNVFVAGASGTLGVPLVRELVRAGHRVTAMTRTPGKQSMLKSLGATPVLADAFDADAVKDAIAAAAPTHVIHQLTALPKNGMVMRASDLAPTNRLRIEGTRNLLAASIAAGVKRMIGAAFAPLGAFAGSGGALDEAVAANQSLETQILDASARGQIEGVVLRYGMFYGPDNPATRQMIAMLRRRMLPVVRGDRSLLPVIHGDDAVAATIAALERPAKPDGKPLVGAVYDIVDDHPVSMTEVAVTLAECVGAPRPPTIPAWLPKLLAPYMARVTSIRAPLSNAKAREELGWAPAYSSIRDGLSRTLSRAA